ncbi:MAG: hypothetical protein SGJ16_05040 [Nitrospirota bacterium]|nr:hypothetical protein [Nitrospirota bacterium]
MSDLQQRTVIDGQQRVTTLQLLLDVIHGEIAKVDARVPAARLAPLIENSEAFCRNPEDRFKVWPTNRDRPAFNEVMAAPVPVAYDSLAFKHSRLVKAHQFFATQCSLWLQKEGVEKVLGRAAAIERSAVRAVSRSVRARGLKPWPARPCPIRNPLTLVCAKNRR